MFLVELQVILVWLVFWGACSLTDSTISNSSSSSTGLAGNSSTLSLSPSHNSSTLLSSRSVQLLISTSASGLPSTALSTQGPSNPVIQSPDAKPSNPANTPGKSIATSLSLGANSTVANVTLALLASTTSTTISTGTKECAATCSDGGNFTNTANSSLEANVNTATYWNSTSISTTSPIAISSSPQTSYVSGWDAVLSCYTAQAEYQNEWLSWYNGLAVTTLVFPYTITEATYPTFTLCDGWPRVDDPGFSTATTIHFTDYFGDWTSVTLTDTISYTQEILLPEPTGALSIYTTTSYYTAPYVTADGGDYSGPSPDCAIAPTDCASLAYESFYAQFTHTQSSNPYALDVWCDYYDTPIEIGTVFEFGFPCTISIPAVQLIYWPVTLASQDLCHYPFPIDITATPNTFIPTAVAYGMTFTSDENCYLSYGHITAWSNFENGTTTYTLPSGILTVPSSELQSYRASAPGLIYNDIFSFNFADLPPNHVPILAYEGMTPCALYPLSEAGPFCATIFESLYAPQLVYPTQFKELNPLLADCFFDYSGIFDPPTALVPVEWLIAPTTSVGGGDPPTISAPATPGPVRQLNSPTPTITVPFSQISTIADTPDDPSSTGNAIIALGPGTTLTASTNPKGTIYIAGKTLRAGGPAATLPGGEILSAAAGGSIVVLQPPGYGGASTIAVAPLPTTTTTAADDDDDDDDNPPPSAVFAFGGEVVTAVPASDGGLLINGTPLPPGVIATMNGMSMSAAGSTAVVLAAGGATRSILLTAAGAAASAADGDPPAVALFTVADGVELTATSAGGVVRVAGVTLEVGGSAVTTAGVVLSAGWAGLLVAADPSAGNSSVDGAVFAVGSAVFTAYESVDGKGDTVVVIGSQTLTVGGSPVTLSGGEVVSAGASDLLVVGERGTSNVSLSEIPAATTTAMTTSTGDGGSVEPTESLTFSDPITATSEIAPTEASSTQKKNSVQRMDIGWSSVVVGILVCVLTALY